MAARARRMEEQERIVGEPFKRNRHDPRPREPGMGVSDATFRLLPTANRAPAAIRPQGRNGRNNGRSRRSRSEPGPTQEDRAVLRHAIRNAGQTFRHVERRAGIVADPEEKHLPT